MKIKLIGTKDDPVFNDLREKLLKTIHELGISATLDQITDIEEIQKLPITVFPALLINEKFISAGHPISSENLKELLIEQLIDQASKAQHKQDKILLLRTQKCRKSDVVTRFLKQENIPHEIKYLESDPEAQQLAQKYKIRSSPAIIINEQIFNPYQLIEKCQIKHPEETKQLFFKLLHLD